MVQSYNPKQLKDLILRRLGAPVVNVEVTEEQIFECIQRALELYGEYHYNGVNKAYKVIKVKTDDEYKTGVFDLSLDNVFAVTEIVQASGPSIMSMDGSTTYTWATDFILGLTGNSSSCNVMYGPFSGGSGLSYYTQLMQHFGMLKQMFNPKKDFWYNDATGQLSIEGSYKKDDVIIIECYVRSFSDVQTSVASYAGYGIAGATSSNLPSDQYMNPDNRVNGYRAGQENVQNQGSYNNRWVKDYATTLVKELQGYILSKHQNMQLPGGVTIDGIRIIEEAKEEKRVLKEELMLLDTPAMILLG